MPKLISILQSKQRWYDEKHVLNISYPKTQNNALEEISVKHVLPILFLRSNDTYINKY